MTTIIFGRFWMRGRELRLDDFGRLGIDGLKMVSKYAKIRHQIAVVPLCHIKGPLNEL